MAEAEQPSVEEDNKMLRVTVAGHSIDIGEAELQLQCHGCKKTIVDPHIYCTEEEQTVCKKCAPTTSQRHRFVEKVAEKLKRSSLPGHVNMTDILDCCVCGTVMLDGPVYKCENWHTLCPYCYDQHEAASRMWPVCPQCRIPISRSMSKVHDVVLGKLPKTYCSNQGCPVQLTSLDVLNSHVEDTCGYRTTKCPWEECEVRLRALHIPDHLEDRHHTNHGSYGQKITVPMCKKGVKSGSFVQLSFWDAEGFTNTQFFKMRARLQMPLPAPNSCRRGRKIPPIAVVWVEDNSIEDEDSSTFEYILAVHTSPNQPTESKKVLMCERVQKCVAAGAPEARINARSMRFPLWKSGSEGWNGEILMTVTVQREDPYADSDSDESASETSDFVLNNEPVLLMTSEDDEDNEEADAFQNQGMATSRTT